jgi:hypothetical protein
MARGRQLQQVVESLQHEARLSTSTSRGVDNRAYLKHVIKRTQELLYLTYDWPFLRATKETSRKTLNAGQRYYDFPAGISQDRIIRVYRQYGSHIWEPLEQGITPENYTAYDSDADVRADPALRWEYYDQDQFEIWPIPSAESQVWFDALIPLPDLVQEEDIVVLDDVVVYLHAAAEILAADGQKDAQAKLTLGQDRLRRLLGSVSTKQRVVLGAGHSQPRDGHVRLRAVYAR